MVRTTATKNGGTSQIVGTTLPCVLSAEKRQRWRLLDQMAPAAHEGKSAHKPTLVWVRGNGEKLSETS